MKKLDVWLRAGITVTLSEEDMEGLKKDPVAFEKTGKLDKAIRSAVEKGAYKFDGDSYIPSGCFGDDEINSVYEAHYPEGIDVSI